MESGKEKRDTVAESPAVRDSCLSATVCVYFIFYFFLPDDVRGVRAQPSSGRRLASTVS